MVRLGSSTSRLLKLSIISICHGNRYPAKDDARKIPPKLNSKGAPMKIRSGYTAINVESFISDERNHVGQVHIRPLPSQPFPTSMYLECSRNLVDTAIYPVGTQFRIAVIEKQKKGCRPHLYSYHGDDFEVLKAAKKAKKRATR